MAPYLHARLSAVKLAGDPNNPLRVRDDASADELRAEILRHLGVLVHGGVIDLEALPMPDGRDQSGINESYFPTGNGVNQRQIPRRGVSNSAT
jgi:hypothetical protein